MEYPFVICGLGNPGTDYERTRHNVGFMLVEHVARRAGARWTHPDPEYSLSRVRLGGNEVHLLRPMTYMNLSGDAVRMYRVEHGLDIDRFLVVCDDIALPAGQIRLRQRGSDGGQRGLRSIIDRLGTAGWARLRLGVGAPEEMDASDWVTAPLDSGAVAELETMVVHATRCVETWLSEGTAVAMSRFNTRPRPPKGEEEETD